MAAIKPITGVCSIGPNGVVTPRIELSKTEPDPEEPDMTNFFFLCNRCFVAVSFWISELDWVCEFAVGNSLRQLIQLLSDDRRQSMQGLD